MTDRPFTVPRLAERNRVRLVPQLRVERGMAGVYFIALRKLPLVKIGYTKDIYQRQASLQTNCPFRVRTEAFYTVGQAAESALHSFLSRHNYEDEWFKFTRRVERVMMALDEWNASCASADESRAHDLSLFLRFGIRLPDQPDDEDLIDTHITHEWLLHS